MDSQKSPWVAKNNLHYPQIVEYILCEQLLFTNTKFQYA